MNLDWTDEKSALNFQELISKILNIFVFSTKILTVVIGPLPIKIKPWYFVLKLGFPITLPPRPLPPTIPIEDDSND